jgi:hypothetical protein
LTSVFSCACVCARVCVHLFVDLCVWTCVLAPRQALGGTPDPVARFGRSGALVAAAVGSATSRGLLQDLLPDLATLLAECVQPLPGTRPCAREVVDRLLGIAHGLGAVGPGV